MVNPGRTARSERKTKETDIVVSLNLDGTGTCEISTGIPNAVFLPKPFSLSDLTETVRRQLH